MKKVKVEEPRLGLIDPTKPTTVINLDIEEEVQQWLDKVSKFSNHTISSVITLMLSIQCINLDPVAKPRAKKKTVKTRI